MFREGVVGSILVWSYVLVQMQCSFATLMFVAVRCVIDAEVPWLMSYLPHFMLWIGWVHDMNVSVHFFWKLKCRGDSSFITLNELSRTGNLSHEKVLLLAILCSLKTAVHLMNANVSILLKFPFLPIKFDWIKQSKSVFFIDTSIKKEWDCICS